MARRHGIRTGLLSNRDGNVAVEFALIMPMLILVFAGLIDFGRAFYDRMALDTAARSAVQYARKNPSDAQGITTAARRAGGLPAGVTVDPPRQFCECPSGAAVSCGSTCASGEPYLILLSVTVRYNFQPLVPYPGLPSPLPLAGSAVIRVQ